jgi:hypothetical protein
MVKTLISTLFVLVINITTYSQHLQTPYFVSNGNQTPTYSDVFEFYSQLKNNYSNIQIESKSYHTDVAENIVLIKLTKGHTAGKVNVLINNGIHPGEPEGIDASMILTHHLLAFSSGNKLPKQKYFNESYPNSNLFADILDYMNIYIIPVYNVDGSLRRNSTSRANQNGPEEYGFRGNARNLDLNRDFIKLDTRNAESFVKIFNEIKPHVFIDTHTSNGADYQHIVTYIATQRNKLQADISNYQYNTFIPQLNKQLSKYNFDAVPYVNAWGNTPDSGWAAFYESPRFATGYSTLFNTIGFTLETHMLKNYKQRVEGSYAFLFSCLAIIKKDAKLILETKLKADKEVLAQQEFYLNWKLDSSQLKYIEFKGYEAAYKKSEVSGMERLYYDQKKPFTKKVKYYEHYKPTTSVSKPSAYLIPYAWKEVISRLKLNGVEMVQIKIDTTILVNAYYIDEYKTVQKPYEGHYLHSNVKVHTEQQIVKVNAGDYIVYTNQQACRFIIETLEPQAIDSYFNWNFFDEVLAQKEYFSDYVFEDTAAELLKKDPALKEKLEKKKSEDKKFGESAAAQLDFIYRNSSYFEKSYLRYPIFRIEK